MSYRCESCGQSYEEPWCDKCQLELTASGDALPAPAPAPAPRPRPVPLRVVAEPSIEPAAPAPEPPPPPLPSQPQAQATRTTRTIVGLDKFNGFLAEGRKAIVICGASQSGKSEIASGFTRANNIYRGKAAVRAQRAAGYKQYVLGGTGPGEVWFQPAGDDYVFLDPAGEFFRALSEYERQRLGLELTDEYFDFIRSAVQKLAGVVLVFDLTREFDDELSVWRQQEDEFNFLLAALRWLRFDKLARRPEHGVFETIVSRAARLPRLDVPVLVLFSKGDRLEEYTTEPPLKFAKLHLPVLHGSLMTNAKRYRYDFCHTMVRTGSGDRAVDRPCGVLLAIEWLLDDRFRWIPRLPSRWLGGGK